MPARAGGPAASIRYVIDASVARASGPHSHTGRQHRAFLTEVYGICHRYLMTEEISTEWHSQASGYAKRWRVWMLRAGKECWLDDPADAALRQAIADLPIGQEEIEAMLEDVHLVEAALRTDAFIVSIDTAARDSLVAPRT